MKWWIATAFRILPKSPEPAMFAKLKPWQKATPVRWCKTLTRALKKQKLNSVHSSVESTAHLTHKATCKEEVLCHNKIWDNKWLVLNKWAGACRCKINCLLLNKWAWAWCKIKWLLLNKWTGAWTCKKCVLRHRGVWWKKLRCLLEVRRNHLLCKKSQRVVMTQVILECYLNRHNLSRWRWHEAGRLRWWWTKWRLLRCSRGLMLDLLAKMMHFLMLYSKAWTKGDE